MPDKPAITIKSLKEQVYEYLREQLRTGKILPGSALNLDETSRKLGVSRTPLRDALLQLEMEGFVTIHARRGIVVNSLSLQDIQSGYEVIGALESTALRQAFSQIGAAEIKAMEDLIEEMKKAIEADDFDLYYEKNLALHDVYLKLCGNEPLVRIVTTMKKRLYDFPRQRGYVKEWELASIVEHTELLNLIRQRKIVEAAAFIRDVHWSFEVQKKFITLYYADAANPGTRSKDGRTP
ncbi:MAG: GntR family transcriptional regulator [Candidatus Aminicenantes bacterium]|nr:GntR family transcriptional regulator [Candidatus Aminicenantes bacterium]